MTGLRWPRCTPTLILPLLCRSDEADAVPPALPDHEVAPVPIRLPDHFHALREVAGLSNTAYRLHMSALSWCSVNATGGLITQGEFGLVAAQSHASKAHAMDCERSGAWHDARNDCGSEFCLGPVDADGWVIHDFYLFDAPDQEAQAADSAALEKRRSADAERQRRARERKAAESAEPPRKRGRPHKPNKTAKPQVKNASRDAPENTSRDPSRDPVIDRSDLDPDFNLRNSVAVNQSKSDARGKPGEDPALVAAVADAISAKTGHVPTDGQALAVIEAVRKRARKAGKPIRNPLRYIPVSVANEPDLYAGLLYGDPPPLEEILAGEADGVPPGHSAAEVHEYDPHPYVADICRACDNPKSSWRHLPLIEARTA